MSSNVENDLLHRAESESQISSMSRVDSTVPPIPVAEPSGDINTRTNSAVAGAVPRRKTTQKKMTTTTSVAISRRTLENQYTTKRKRYLLLKKELVQKQKATQDLYDDISELRKKLLACGAKDPGKLDNFKTTEALPVKSSIDKNVRARDNFEEETVVPYKENPSFNVDFVVAMTEKLKDIPRNCHELCQAAIEKHSAIATWLAELKSEVDVVDPSILTRIESFRSENENLRLQLNDLTSFQTETVSDIAQNASALFNEYETCCSRLKRLDTTVSDQEDRKEIRDRLNAALCELRFERDENIETKERRSQAETHLQKARTRIRDLENRVASDENKIQQLQNTQKSLEVQLKQKEQSIEQRMKDVHKTMKNNDGLVTKMEKQRDTLEARLKELKEKMTAKEIESLDTAKEMTEKMEALNSEINEEREKREQMENAYAEMEERYRDLEGKSQELCLLAEKNKGFSVTDANHTENEIRLFNDLQIERAEVEKQKEEIARLEEEKEEITAVMHQAANEAEDESKDKLAADLIVKSNDLQNLTMEYMRLQRVTNDFEEKNKALEEQLIEIRNQLHAQSKEGGKAAWGVHVIELQQQISDLRNNLAEVTSHNENLETKLTQKQLELEQRDRIMREQSKFLKVKDELLGLLKGKEARLDSSRENSNEDENLEDINQINEQIAAKTEAIQELYSTLENKQMQVMRLEKIVKQMEDHQDHAQAQRTRLENRIAQLELALQEKNKDHRYVRQRSTPTLKSNTENDYESQSPLRNNKSALLRPMMPPTLHRSLTLRSPPRSPSMQRRCQYDKHNSIAIRKENARLDDSLKLSVNHQDSRQIRPSDSDQIYLCKRCQDEEQCLRKFSSLCSNREHSNDRRVHDSRYDRFVEPTFVKIHRNLSNYHPGTSPRDSSVSIPNKLLPLSDILHARNLFTDYRNLRPSSHKESRNRRSCVSRRRSVSSSRHIPLACMHQYVT